MTKKFTALFAIVAMSLALSGCVGLAVGAGATAGVAAAQEGGIKVAATDTAIRVQIADAWFKHSTTLLSKLDMTVKEGRVLVTGSVPTPDLRVDAIRLVWQVNGVRQVINEIRVDNSYGVGSYATDTWITSSLKTKLLLDKYIQSINFTVETVGGTVYLMGIAQDQKELNRVVNHARNLKYVKNVVSYVRLRGEVPVGTQSPTSAQPREPAPVQQMPSYEPPPVEQAPIYDGSVEQQPLQ